MRIIGIAKSYSNKNLELNCHENVKIQLFFPFDFGTWDQFVTSALCVSLPLRLSLPFFFFFSANAPLFGDTG